MAIISASNRSTKHWYGNTQFRYGMIYVIITFFVLLFLNYYAFSTTHTLFCQSKEASMVEKCHLTAAEIGNLEVLNKSNVTEIVNQMDSLRVTRLVITNQDCVALYDSATQDSLTGSYVLFPEIIQAMETSQQAPYGNDAFIWLYSDGAMQSRAATPILSYGTIIGCVYMMEYDTTQGALIQSLQQNIFNITLVLEILILIFSFTFSHAFSIRFRKIIHSISIIREGDYSHTVNLPGSDELSLLADEFNDLTARLQTSENKRRQFVSDASHELKTPLASIKLLSDSILQNDMDMDTVREFVGDIGNEAERLNRMSQKLLSLSKVEVSQDTEYELVHIPPTIQRVVRMLSGQMKENQIRLDLKIETNPTILIYEDDLYQIIFNLVENGIKYNKSGGSLCIQLLKEQDNVVLKIQDSGVGIPEDAQEQIFERFYRVDKARSRKTGGSGLGLSIVRTLVERNQGSISVQSTINVGTVFTVTFPIFDEEEDHQ